MRRCDRLILFPRKEEVRFLLHIRLWILIRILRESSFSVKGVTESVSPSLGKLYIPDYYSCCVPIVQACPRESLTLDSRKTTVAFEAASKSKSVQVGRSTCLQHCVSPRSYEENRSRFGITFIALYFVPRLSQGKNVNNQLARNCREPHFRELSWT